MIIRIISGIIGIIITAVAVQLGGLTFSVFAILLSLIGWFEFSSMMKSAGFNITFFSGIPILVLMLCCAWLGNVEELMAVLTLGMIFIFFMTILFNGSVRPVDACSSIAGILYIGLPFSHLIWLRFLDDERIEMPVDTINNLMNNGIDVNQTLNTLMSFNFDVGSALIWILFFCTWSSDTFAYFVGTAFGSHKLAKSISPNKTVEGFLGGLFGTTAVAILIGHFVFNFPLIEMAILGFILAIVATFGDLVESVIKRFVGVKDSGILLPGHGGMLDRFDSILFTAPVFYYFIIITGLI